MANQQTVGIVGAGTMGAGIAQVAVSHGWTAKLIDVDVATVEKAVASVRARLDRNVEKGRMTEAERDDAAARLQVPSGPADLGDCDLIIEAIVEDLEIKANTLRAILPALSAAAIIATNTSSLSVSTLGERIGQAHRTVGMHFFNPAPILRLVEVIAGRETDPAIVDRVAEIAASWGKKVARAADVPGFIVNHVARPYYLEAFRIVEDGLATIDAIDQTMTSVGGFRMGPFELTDLIGQDVNAATTRSVWEQTDRPPLLKPSRLQEQLVLDGRLGRKAGVGAYRYDADTPAPALEVTPVRLELPTALRETVVEFAQRGAAHPPEDEVQAYIFARILAAIIAQAAHARASGVASTADIDTALRYGVNYPAGPFEWADRIGWTTCTTLLEQLNAAAADDRFALPAETSSGV